MPRTSHAWENCPPNWYFSRWPLWRNRRWIGHLGWPELLFVRSANSPSKVHGFRFQPKFFERHPKSHGLWEVFQAIDACLPFEFESWSGQSDWPRTDPCHRQSYRPQPFSKEGSHPWKTNWAIKKLRETVSNVYFVFPLQCVPDLFVNRHSHSGINGMSIEGRQHSSPK